MEKTYYNAVKFVDPHINEYLWFKGENGASFDITLNYTGISPETYPDIYYSFDKKTWNKLTIGVYISVSSGKKIYFKGDNETISYYPTYYNFICESLLYCGGNIMSLLDSTLQSKTISHDDCFGRLFRNMNIITAPALPATTLAGGCYSSMFQSCTSLVTPPTLPATTLANSCYTDMFRGCTSLTTAPALPATTLANSCYSAMFTGCTSLVTAPALPATSLASYCYHGMFSGCTSLATAPALPATTLRYWCYRGMFEGCTSLITAPALPATTLNDTCYHSMFKGCTSLATAPALPATTLDSSCYQSMFEGCTSLATAPALPATILKYSCYAGMFEGCTSLVTPPTLPATTLASSCYAGMFGNCYSLKVYTTSGTGHDKEWKIPSTGAITGTTRSMSNMFSGVDTDSVPATWPGTSGQQFTYYTQNNPV